MTTCWLQKQPFTVIDVGQLTLAVAYYSMGGSVAEWLVSWTRDAIGPGFKSAVTLSVNNLGQTVHTHRASVHQAAKLVAALLRVVWWKIITAYCWVCDSRHLQTDCQEPGSALEPYAR